jgi:hypothetical protein
MAQDPAATSSFTTQSIVKMIHSMAKAIAETRYLMQLLR